MVDILSGGRLDFGIGRGYQPKEFRGLGISMEKTRERFDEATISGDPEEVADKIRQHHEALGITYFMASFNRGGIPHDRIVRSMRLFGEKVMPRFA